MKKYVIPLLGTLALVILAPSCGASKTSPELTEAQKAVFEETENDTVSISSEETEYEIIIIQPGFNTFLNSVARPPGYYSQNFLE